MSETPVMGPCRCNPVSTLAVRDCPVHGAPVMRRDDNNGHCRVCGEWRAPDGCCEGCGSGGRIMESREERIRREKQEFLARTAERRIAAEVEANPADIGELRDAVERLYQLWRSVEDLERKNVSRDDDLLHARELRALRDQVDELHEGIDKAFKLQAAHAYHRMADEKVGSTDIDGTNFVRNAPTWYGTVQDWDEFRPWAQVHAPQLLEPEKPLAKGRLNELVRERIDNNEKLPPGVGAYPDERLSMRKGRS